MSFDSVLTERKRFGRQDLEPILEECADKLIRYNDPYHEFDRHDILTLSEVLLVLLHEVNKLKIRAEHG